MQNCRILGTYQWYHTMSFVMTSGLSWMSLARIGILDLRVSIYPLLHQIELHHHSAERAPGIFFNIVKRHKCHTYWKVNRIGKTKEELEKTHILSSKMQKPSAGQLRNKKFMAFYNLWKVSSQNRDKASFSHSFPAKNNFKL